jgi:hypothetical protein
MLAVLLAKFSGFSWWLGVPILVATAIAIGQNTLGLDVAEAS